MHWHHALVHAACVRAWVNCPQLIHAARFGLDELCALEVDSLFSCHLQHMPGARLTTQDLTGMLTQKQLPWQSNHASAQRPHANHITLA
jgi:hypothetical protein